MEPSAQYYRLTDHFELLMTAAWATAARLSVTRTGSPRQEYGAIIFDKLIAHACSLERLVPLRERTAGLIWDISSISAISRCMMETYAALAYFALEEISDDEHAFRLRLAELHDTDRRLQVARTMNLEQASIEPIAGELANCRTSLQSDPFFASLPSKSQRSLVESPRDFHKTRQERNSSANIDDNFYHSAQVYLSQFVHSHHFSLRQLNYFAANTGEGYQAMKIPLWFALAFLARGIQGMYSLFTLDLNELPDEQRGYIYEYAAMAGAAPDEARSP